MSLVRGSLLRRSLLISLLISPLAAVAGASASISLYWTAPGDDSLIGRATRYDVRYSLQAITAANFAAATVVTGLPTPPAGGEPDSLTVGGLTAGLPYFFAIKTVDENNNWSAMSNVLYGYPAVLGVQDAARAISLAAPWPNPASSLTHFEYALPVTSEVSANVYDITGRLVREIASGRRSAGRGEFVWNLRDESGRAVHAGIYLVRTRIAGRVWTHRVAVAT